MIYLDTHVLVWLYAGLKDKLSELAKNLINDNEVYISAIVRLELQYLYEIKRITDDVKTQAKIQAIRAKYADGDYINLDKYLTNRSSAS